MSRARDTANQINRVNSSAADATAITVDSSERVMIGTSASSSSSNVKLLMSGSSGAFTQYSHNGGAGSVVGTPDASTLAFYTYTGNIGAETYTERMRILPSGGITFNGDTAAANALDDYEEGTWTPTVGGTATYSVQKGSYTKIGKIVFIYGEMLISSIGTGTTNFLSGLPFNGNEEHTINISKLVNSSTSVYYANLRTSGASLYFAYQNGLDGTWTANPSFLTTSTQIQFSGTYLTN